MTPTESALRAAAEAWLDAPYTKGLPYFARDCGSTDVSALRTMIHAVRKERVLAAMRADLARSGGTVQVATCERMGANSG